MPWLESLFRKRVEVPIPPEVERQSQEALNVLVNIHGLLHIRGFGSGFMNPERWNPNRSDVDVAAIFDNSNPDLSCFAHGTRRRSYNDEEGEEYSHPTQTDLRAGIRAQVAKVAPLVSLFMLTKEDILKILQGHNESEYRVFLGMGNFELKRLIHDIQKGKLLWPK